MNDETTTQKEHLKCEHCGRLTSLRDAMKVRETKYPAIKEIGVNCPHCDHWTHGYFETPRIVKERQLLQQHRQRATETGKALATYQHSKRRFQRLFDRENKRLRRELGVARELGVSGAGR